MEDFATNKKVKGKRENFMGAVKEVNPTLTRPEPVAKPAAQPTPTPPPTPQATAPAPEQPAQPTPEAVATGEGDDKPQITLKRGYLVGYTEEGVVALRPFGDIGNLELVGLVEYSKTKTKDLLEQVAGTQIADIKKGVTVLAQGVNSLLKGGGAEAS